MFNVVRKNKIVSLVNRRGFTIVEALSVSVILMFVLMALFSVYVMLSQYVRDTTAQAVSQSRVRIAINRIANDIRLASDISVTRAGTSIDLTFQPSKLGASGNSWTSRYKLVGNQLLYIPDVSSSDETVILENVFLNPGQSLFEYNETKKLVTIYLNVENSSLTTTQYTPLITAVKANNIS